MKKGIKGFEIFIILCVYTSIGFAQNDSIIFSIIKPLCYANCNGSILASVSGTNAPYSFLWSNGATTNSITNLCAVDYTLSVTNSNSVTITSTVSLNQPNQFVFYSYCGLYCSLATSGTTICVSNVMGGTPPYSFSLYDINNSPVIQNFSWCTSVPQGVYNILATDSNNCQASLYGNYIILDSANYNTTFSSPTCSTCCDGVVQLNFTNPCPTCSSTLYQAGITYTSSTNTFTNVCLGSYTITATNFGCSSVIIDTLHRPTGIHELIGSKDFELFPNPSNGIIKIKYNKDVNRITIINSLGILIKEIYVENTTATSVDLSIFAKGIYLFEFIDKGHRIITHKKIVLE